MLIAPLCAILLGLVFLVYSADKFTAYAALIAQRFGMSQMMVGLTIVAFGTSAPEVIVSINAALANASNIALGNAIGSNLANVGLVLGITALILPIQTRWDNTRFELLAVIAISALAGFFLLKLELTRLNGFILLVALFGLCAMITVLKLRSPCTEENTDIDLPDAANNSSLLKPTLLFVWFLVLLIGSANALVWGSKIVALHYGVSELVVGLTIVAIGTSLPELAAALASALKGHHDIALGGILGSNLFNIGAVLGLAGVIQPFKTSADAVYRDYLAMFILTLILAALVLIPYLVKRTNNLTIGRLAGVGLLIFYIGYAYWLLSSGMTQ